MILVHTLTEATGDAATTALDLLTAVEGPLVRVTADAASDTVAGYELATARGATVIIPPAKTANLSGHGPWSPARDRTITVVKQLGENTCFRYTSIIGDGLRAWGAGTGSPRPRPWTSHLASDGANRRCSDGTAGRRQRSAGGWAARSRRVSECALGSVWLSRF